MRECGNIKSEDAEKLISSISSKSDSGASISGNKGGSSTTIGSNNTSSNNRSSSNSNSRSSNSSNSNGSVGSNDSFGSNPGVSSNNSGRMRLLDRLLSASGADSIGTVLDDLDINDFLADSLGDLPGGADGDLVAGSDGNTVTEGSGCCNWASITITSISIGISIGLSFTLSISSNTISSNTSNNTSNNSSGTNGADNRAGGNSTISSRDSMSRDTVGNNNLRGGYNTSGDNLGVLAYNT